MNEEIKTIKHLHYDLEMEITNPDLIDRDFVFNAIQRQIPQKPKEYPYAAGQCPSCDAVFDFDWETKPKFCGNCGQKLQWESDGEKTE